MGDEDNANLNEDRIQEGGREAKKRKIVVDAVWEMGQTWVERGKI